MGCTGRGLVTSSGGLCASGQCMRRWGPRGGGVSARGVHACCCMDGCCYMDGCMLGRAAWVLAGRGWARLWRFLAAARAPARQARALRAGALTKTPPARACSAGPREPVHTAPTPTCSTLPKGELERECPHKPRHRPPKHQACSACGTHPNTSCTSRYRRPTSSAKSASVVPGARWGQGWCT